MNVEQKIARAMCKIRMQNVQTSKRAKMPKITGSGFFCEVQIGEDTFYGLCTSNQIVDADSLRAGHCVTCYFDDKTEYEVRGTKVRHSYPDPDSVFIELTNKERYDLEHQKDRWFFAYGKIGRNFHWSEDNYCSAVT